MEFWGIGICKDEPYVQKLGPYLDYWKNILELLSKPLPTQNSTLLEGFWPLSNWISSHMWGATPPIVDVDCKDRIITPYCGPKTMWPSLKIVAYILFWDLGPGDFILVRLVDLELCPMWMGRAKVKLWRMNNLIILDMFIFNVGCQWEKEQGTIERWNIVSRLLGEQMEVQFGKPKTMGWHFIRFIFLSC
jgi:hypothetical protein